MGSNVFHLGALGAGSAMKLAVNTVVYALNQGISEGLVLAERAGIRRDAAYEVFANSAVAAPFVHYRRAQFERPGDMEPALSLRLAAKDLRLILRLAASVDLKLPQAEDGSRRHGRGGRRRPCRGGRFGGGRAPPAQRKQRGRGMSATARIGTRQRPSRA